MKRNDSGRRKKGSDERKRGARERRQRSKRNCLKKTSKSR